MMRLNEGEQLLCTRGLERGIKQFFTGRTVADHHTIGCDGVIYAGDGEYLLRQRIIGTAARHDDMRALCNI